MSLNHTTLCIFQPLKGGFGFFCVDLLPPAGGLQWRVAMEGARSQVLLFPTRAERLNVGRRGSSGLRTSLQPPDAASEARGKPPSGPPLAAARGSQVPSPAQASSPVPAELGLRSGYSSRTAAGRPRAGQGKEERSRPGPPAAAAAAICYRGNAAVVGARPPSVSSSADSPKPAPPFSRSGGVRRRNQTRVKAK